MNKCCIYAVIYEYVLEQKTAYSAISRLGDITLYAVESLIN